MRARASASALLIALAVVLAACGGGSSDGSSGSDGATTAPASAGGSDSGSDAGSDTGTGGDVDCAAIEDASAQLISIQLLAQLDDPDTVAQIKENQIGALDLDEFEAALATLHQLDGFSSPLGDPEEAISFYEDAAVQAQELFDADPVTQEQIDAYQDFIGSPAEFLGHQTAISGALDEAGC